MTDILTFAERILFAETLEEKLSPPSADLVASMADISHKRSGFTPPTWPGRPPELAMGSTTKGRTTAFPAPSKLDNPRARGLVLHFFANHELLAMELMALAILKFADAPEGFLRGIVQTIADEQRHMTFYLKRMKELEVELGEAPLNAFFWTSLRDMKSPMEYAAAMSLTFEQANLDFATHFANLFQTIGDAETSDILVKVRDDEIGHVKHGLVWFDRWRDPAKSLWQAYCEELRFPLTPARAKGTVFFNDVRVRAGLDADFISELAVYSHSKGRPPRVFLFNPSCEYEIAHGGIGYAAPKVVADMTADLASTLMFVAHRDDIVLVPKRPTREWIHSMKDLGFEIPEFLERNKEKITLNLVGKKMVGELCPWGWSPQTHHDFSELGTSSAQEKVFPSGMTEILPANGNIFSKSFAAKLRGEGDLPSVIATSISDINRSITEFRATGWDVPVIIKTPFASSGRGMIRVDTEEVANAKDQTWCQRELDRSGELVIQPWVQRIADLSSQIEVTRSGEVRMIGMTRFVTTAKGQYKGHFLGKLMEGIPVECVQEWHKSFLPRFEACSQKVGEALFQAGYFGPAGVDGFLYKHHHKFGFQALGEINPRFTMGRVALGLAKNLQAKRPGIWLHITRDNLKGTKHLDFPSLVNALQNLIPTKMKRVGTSTVIEQGVVPTNDPALASWTLSLLIASTSLDDTLSTLGSVGFDERFLEPFR